MKRILGPLSTCVLLAACGVGDSTTPPGGDDDVDERVACEATLAMSGTFTAPVALDPAMGCQPVGTWNVNVALLDMGTCTEAIPFKPNYQYTVSGDGTARMITYGGSGDELKLNISAGGSGQCDAAFTHLSPASGAMFNEFVLHPWTAKATAAVTTLTIMGEGSYTLWKERP